MARDAGSGERERQRHQRYEDQCEAVRRARDFRHARPLFRRHQRQDLPADVPSTTFLVVPRQAQRELSGDGGQGGIRKAPEPLERFEDKVQRRVVGMGDRELRQPGVPRGIVRSGPALTVGGWLPVAVASPPAIEQPQ